jgi:hypothetical protein
MDGMSYGILLVAHTLRAAKATSAYACQGASSAPRSTARKTQR